MAPELLAKKGYTWHVDYWSLGVSMWEMLFHKRPFDGRSSEKLTSSIVSAKLKMPTNVDEICSPEGQQLLLSLLDRNPKTRMACQSRERGLAEFQKHPWFASLDWDKLLAKELPPPFVPDIKRANFDVSHELDEFLMVEKPLTHSSRKKNVDFDKLKPEFREMEEQFGVYDSTKGNRTSYYPHNQPVLGGTGNDSTMVIPSATNTQTSFTAYERSLAGTPGPPLSTHSRDTAVT